MLVQSASRYLRRCCARATGARAADTLPAEKFSAFCEDKKEEEEAGNPGVVFMKSGFIHGKVSNTRSFFVLLLLLLGLKLTQFVLPHLSSASLRFGSAFRVGKLFLGDLCAVSAARGDFHAWKRMKYIYIDIHNYINKSLRECVCVYICLSLYICARACAYARSPNKNKILESTRIISCVCG